MRQIKRDNRINYVTWDVMIIEHTYFRLPAVGALNHSLHSLQILFGAKKAAAGLSMPFPTVQSELPRAKSSALPVRSVRDSVALSAAQLKLESSYRRPWSSNCRGGGAGRPRSPPPLRFRRGS